MRILSIFIISLCFLKGSAVDYDKEFARLGFEDVQSLDNTIVVDLKYSGIDNFMGIDMYGGLNKAYLRPEIAVKLLQAQALLKEHDADYSLIVYDASRPISAQKMMFDKVQGTEFEQYVANPYNGGGHHCYGCAVDVSLLYKGAPVDMGTEFDSFSELSHIDNEEDNLRLGLIDGKACENRRLLRSIMVRVGFYTEPCEWWHFSCYKINYVREYFPRLDF